MNAKQKTISDELGVLDLLAISELITALEKRWGVQRYVAVRQTNTAPVVVEQPTSFSLILSAIGPNKMNVIKEFRAITKKGLAEAKTLVESAPVEFMTDVPLVEAESIQKQLASFGATVTIK